MILAAELLLHHLGEESAAHRIRRALLKALSKKDALTPDIGGKGTTATFTEAILRAMKRG
jgi:isocitrate dehydrogenase (NAD+)